MSPYVSLPQPALAPFVRYFVSYQLNHSTDITNMTNVGNHYLTNGGLQFRDASLITKMPANPFSGLIFAFKVPLNGRFYYQHHPQAMVKILDECALIGQSSAFAISETTGDANMIVVTLTGNGLQHLLSESAGSVNNQAFKFSTVNHYFDGLQEKLWQVDQAQDAVALIENTLLLFFYEKKNISTFDLKDVSVITRYIEKNNGMLSIKALAEKFRITPRWLEKLFYQQVGLSPKTYSRVIRFNATIQYLSAFADPTAKWDSAVEQFGYTDQSHFIKDFQALLGTSPTQFFQNDLSFNKASQNAV